MKVTIKPSSSNTRNNQWTINIYYWHYSLQCSHHSDTLVFLILFCSFLVEPSYERMWYHVGELVEPLCWLPTLFNVYLVLLNFNECPCEAMTMVFLGNATHLLYFKVYDWSIVCVFAWSISLGSRKSSILNKPNYLLPHWLPSKFKHKSLQSKSKNKFSIGDLQPLYLCVWIDTHIQKCIDGI